MRFFCEREKNAADLRVPSSRMPPEAEPGRMIFTISAFSRIMIPHLQDSARSSARKFHSFSHFSGIGLLSADRHRNQRKPCHVQTISNPYHPLRGIDARVRPSFCRGREAGPDRTADPAADSACTTTRIHLSGHAGKSAPGADSRSAGCRACNDWRGRQRTGDDAWHRPGFDRACDE